jgi:hypothetical protein
MRRAFTAVVSRMSLVTSTIEASVLAARAAVRRENFPQVLAGSMKADVQVVAGQAELRGDVVWILSFEVDSQEQVAILLRNRRKEAMEALAEETPVVGTRLFGELSGKAIKRPPAGIVAPIEVDDGMTQNPVEPTHRVFFRFRFARRRECPDERILDEVLREALVANAAAGESDEELQVFQNRLFDAFHPIRVTFRVDDSKEGSKEIPDSRSSLAKRNEYRV